MALPSVSLGSVGLQARGSFFRHAFRDPGGRLRGSDAGGVARKNGKKVAETSSSIEQRLANLGQSLVDREGAEARNREEARRVAQGLHERVERALKAYHEAVSEVPFLRVVLSELRLDDKHLHAIEFELERGRHRAIVTIKQRGEVTLVGPFRLGKAEGPCRSFPFSAEGEIEHALGDFLCHFIEAAVSP